MFLTKNYVLSNELVQEMDIHIANISMLHKQLEGNENISAVIKMGQSTFIDRTSPDLPNNIKLGLRLRDYTDMSNKLPLSYFLKEMRLTRAKLKDILKNKYVLGIVTICEKEFIEFSHDFVQKTKECILYPLDTKETSECITDNSIDGYTKLTDNCFLTWYNARGQGVGYYQSSF